jgi:hypothetical protein
MNKMVLEYLKQETEREKLEEDTRQTGFYDESRNEFQV